MASPEIRIKEEPLDITSPEIQVEPFLVSGCQLPVGVHHRLRNYNRSVHTSSPENFSCEVCQGEYPNQEVLQKHKLLHFNTRHVCYSCDCYFLNTDTLIMHMSTIHGALSVGSQNHKGEIFVCTICLQRFSSSKILQKHETSHALKDEGNFTCKICASDFQGYKALLAHLNSPRHRDMKVKIQSIFVCVDCRAIFASRDAYAMHMMVRAQNETCDCKHELPRSKKVSPKEVPSSYVHPIEDGNKFVSGIIEQAMTNDTRSPSPLNLSIQTKDPINNRQPKSSPIQRFPTPSFEKLRGRHKCPRCREHFHSQDALAMHVMMHAKSEAEDEHEHSIKSKLSAAMIARTHALLAGSIMPRTPSVPVLSAQHFHTYKHDPTWTCTICLKLFDSCDTLAMHVMDKHTASSSKNEQKPDVSEDAPSEPESSTGNFSRKSHKRPLSNVAEPSAPNMKRKRCMSLDFIGSVREEESLTKRCHSADDVARHLEIREAGLDGDKDNQFPTSRPPSNYQMTPENCCESESATDNRENAKDTRSDGYKVLKNDEYLRELTSGEEFRAFCNFESSEMNSSNDVTTNERADPLMGSSSGRSYEEEHPEASKNCTQTPEENSFPVCGLNRRSKRKQRIASKIVHYVPSGMNQWNVQEDDSPETSSERSVKNEVSPLDLKNNRENPVIGQMRGQESTDPPMNGASSPASDGTAETRENSRSNLVEDADLLEYIIEHVNSLTMCRFCGIIFTDHTMYYLHMGLHNVNNPWQCNLCGKVCSGVHQFSSHVLHY